MTATDNQRQQVIQLLQTKASERAIVEQTGLSRRQIRKIKQEAQKTDDDSPVAFDHQSTMTRVGDRANASASPGVLRAGCLVVAGVWLGSGCSASLSPGPGGEADGLMRRCTLGMAANSSPPPAVLRSVYTRGGLY